MGQEGLEAKKMKVEFPTISEKIATWLGMPPMAINIFFLVLMAVMLYLVVTKNH